MRGYNFIGGILLQGHFLRGDNLFEGVDFNLQGHV